MYTRFLCFSATTSRDLVTLIFDLLTLILFRILCLTSPTHTPILIIQWLSVTELWITEFDHIFVSGHSHYACAVSRDLSSPIGRGGKNGSYFWNPWPWQLWCIDPSTAPLRPTYSHVSHAFPTWRPDDGCGLLPHIVWTFRPFVSLQSAGGGFRFLVPPSGTTCTSTLHLRRHSRFSDNDSRPNAFPFRPRHYHMTRVLLSPFITTVWTPVVLAIINII